MVEVNNIEQIRQTIRGYTFNIENPPLTSEVDINENPAVMWRVVEKEGGVLGFFPPCWYGIYPGRQAVPEDDPEAFHFMVSPKKDNFSTPRSLTVGELGSCLKFVREFLNSDKRLAGFNISEERRDRRDQVQSWANFHVHCLSLPRLERIEPLVKIPDRHRERLNSLTKQLLVRLLGSTVKPDDGVVTNPSEVETDLVLPQRELLLRLSDDIAPEQMAVLVKKLDIDFRKAHEEVFSLFVKNYRQDVAWNRLPYKLRTSSETRTLIGSSRFDRKTKTSLLKLVDVLKPEESVESSQKIFQLPTYTLNMFVDKKGHLYISLFPYIFRRLGAPEALGVYPNSRFIEGASNKERKQRAKKAFDETLQKLS